MNRTPFPRSAERLLDPRELRSLALLCGAGVSIESGIPLVRPMLSFIYERIKMLPEHQALLWDARLPFETVMQKLAEAHPIDRLLDIYALRCIAPAHLFVAHLVRSTLCRYVVTTNFDQNIEAALEAVGLNLRQDFTVTIAGSQPALRDASRTGAVIAKVHGCVSDRASIAVTIGEIFLRRTSPLVERAIHHLIAPDAGPHEAVVVLGYSCSDAFDVTPAVERAKRGKEVFLFIHTADRSLWREEALQNLPDNPFRLHRGHAIYCDVSAFIDEWNVRMGVPPLPKGSNLPDWRLDVQAWFDEARRRRPDAEFPSFMATVAGHLLNTVSAHDAADHYYREALATCGGSKQALGAALANVGNNLRGAGRVVEASNFLARALDQAEAIGDRRADLMRSLNLGHTLARAGKYHEAVERFTRVMEASEQLQDMVLYHKALASRASSLSALKKHDAAEADIRRAIKYASEASRLDEELARRNNLAVILGAAGETSTALDELTTVEQTARKLGDPRLEALAMSNRATHLCRLGQHDAALRALETACRTFQTLPDPLNVAKCQGERGRVLVFLKRFDEAIDACEAAIRTMDSTGQRQGLSILWEILACALSGAGRVAEAREAEAVAERLRTQYD